MKSNLSQHKQVIHEGVPFTCNKCEYKATRQCHLTQHIQAKHECVKYECETCGYKTSNPLSLASHMQYKHESTQNSCNDSQPIEQSCEPQNCQKNTQNRRFLAILGGFGGV